MRTALFVHNGVTGRFRFLAAALRERGWSGAVLNPRVGGNLEGFETVVWKADENPPGSRHSLVRSTEARLRAGEAAAGVALQLKQSGFSPDLVIGHPAWGEMLFLR